MKSSLMKHDPGSLYFIIPQIELNECEGFCLLAGTLVWSDPFLCNFEQTLHSYETSLFQVINHLPAMQEACCANFMHSTVQKFGIVEDKNLEMVYTNAQALGGYNNAASIVEMVSPSS